MPSLFDANTTFAKIKKEEYACSDIMQWVTETRKIQLVQECIKTYKTGQMEIRKGLITFLPKIAQVKNELTKE